MNGQDELDTFIIDILDKKQLSGIDEDVRKQLVNDLKTQLIDQINRALIAALPGSKVDELNVLLDRDVSEEEIRQFVVDAGVDVKRVTVETMLQFRSLYLGNAE